jgi:hypothetical protein
MTEILDAASKGSAESSGAAGYAVKYETSRNLKINGSLNECLLFAEDLSRPDLPLP